jgi:hypothetical protein
MGISKNALHGILLHGKAKNAVLRSSILRKPPRPAAVIGITDAG